MRFWKKGVLYSLSLSALLATLIILIQPVRVLASTCTAKCTGGDISVSGSWCSCTDYVGCTYYNSSTQREETQNCGSGGGEAQ
jgi:hypothetical protein